MSQAQEPREGSVRVAGIPWLARMIDKSRLEAAGVIDEFDLEYPCPMDQGLLKQLGLSGDEFQKITLSAKSDEEIVEELKRRHAILT
jgi:hypothetical protein